MAKKKIDLKIKQADGSFEHLIPITNMDAVMDVNGEKTLTEVLENDYATKNYVEDNKFSGDYNDLENRPCYDTREYTTSTFEFDGVYENTDREVVSNYVEIPNTTYSYNSYFVKLDYDVSLLPPKNCYEDNNFSNEYTVSSTNQNGEINETTFETYYGLSTEKNYANVGNFYFVYENITYTEIANDVAYNYDLTQGIWVNVVIYDNGLSHIPKKLNLTHLSSGEKKDIDVKYLETYDKTKPGLKVEGMTFTVYNMDTGEYEERVAERGAEIFNSYELGQFDTIATGICSHAEGDGIATGDYSHSEGADSHARGFASHSEGYMVAAEGECSHVEGWGTYAKGDKSHAEGYDTVTYGENSHAEGHETIASSDNQHVQGKYNIEDTENKYAHIVGNGTKNSARSNAHTLDWDGNAWFQGNVSVDGTPTNDNDLATKKYVDDVTPHLISETTLLTIPAETINTALETYNNSWNGKLRMDTDLINFPSDRVIYVRFGGYEWVVGHGNANGTINIYSLYTEISSANPDTPAHELLSPGQIMLWTTQGKNAANEDDETKTRISLQFSSPEVTDLVLLTKERVFVPNETLPEDLEVINTISRGRIPGTTIGQGSIVFGFGSEATAEAGACFGRELKNNGQCTFMAGACNECTNHYSAVFGYGHVNTGRYSFVEGRQNKNTGAYAHVEGYKNEASASSAHAEGAWTLASGSYAHAEGAGSQAKGHQSHAEGQDTIAASTNQHVQGRYNVEDGSQTYAHIVGNGTSNEVRSNAHTLDWNGNAWFQGNVSVDGTPTNDNDLVTKKYVDDSIPSIDGLATETYVNNAVSGIVDSAPETLNTLNELAQALGDDPNFATTIVNQIGQKADASVLNNYALKTEIPTVTNDLTNELKANYDAAYTHSQATHAPSDAQKNSDITKAEIEAKLTGNIESHTHNQYLTEVPSNYATQDYVDERVVNATPAIITEEDINNIIADIDN